jgi:hypothetical protein
LTGSLKLAYTSIVEKFIFFGVNRRVAGPVNRPNPPERCAPVIEEGEVN